jgi:hypothetical protein
MEARAEPRETLREVARLQGVEASDEDLVAVQSFLEAILPHLAELEQRIPPELAP